jgi:hypothetical protein
MSEMQLTRGTLSSAQLPLMISLMEPMTGDTTCSPQLGAMTKYKTFNGEEINGQKVWAYDYHDDDV